MNKSFLSLSVSNKLAVITIQRPEKKNALNGEMYDDLAKLLNDVSERDDVAITAITGSGDYYSSGNDLMAIFLSSVDITSALDAAIERVRKFVEAFIRHKKILVAVVNGPAIGIGATTLPLCDLVYCTTTAWFQTPFTKLGICAEGASSYTFPKIFGTSKANELLLFNRKINAEEALAIGLVSKVVKIENIENELWKELRENASNLSIQSLLATKQMMRRFDESKLHEANMMECIELKRLFLTEEASQAITKFVTRRSNL